jgi:hypothetical protein
MWITEGFGPVQEQACGKAGPAVNSRFAGTARAGESVTSPRRVPAAPSRRAINGLLTFGFPATFA